MIDSNSLKLTREQLDMIQEAFAPPADSKLGVELAAAYEKFAAVEHLQSVLDIAQSRRGRADAFLMAVSNNEIDILTPDLLQRVKNAHADLAAAAVLIPPAKAQLEAAINDYNVIAGRVLLMAQRLRDGTRKHTPLAMRKIYLNEEEPPANVVDRVRRRMRAGA